MLRLLNALFHTTGPKYSWKKAVLVITLSCTVMLSVAVIGRLVRYSTRYMQSRESASTLSAIIQTGSQSSLQTGMKFAPLPTGYLIEALDLNVDTPVKLSQFSMEEAEERLLATHIIERVGLKKMKPNLLYIDYELREPWAYLEDYTNTAIDPEGFFIPFAPFYSPRSLVKIYLGEHAPPDPWGDRMRKDHLKLVSDLCQALPGESVERVDLSHAESISAGRREIVITLKGGIILRLAPKNCIQQLGYYSILSRSLLKEGAEQMIVDLRLPEIAFVQRLKDDR